MQKKNLITAKTYDELIAKARQIENEEMPAVAREIDEARKHGDLRENAQYAAAKEKQRMIDSKLNEINQALTSHIVFDPSTQKFDTVCFGSKVIIKFLDDNTTKTFTILSDFDSNISLGIMSINAPIIQAILGFGVGDASEITLAGKVREIEIEKIEQAIL
jgi:transcription elongation factor GreA